MVRPGAGCGAEPKCCARLARQRFGGDAAEQLADLLGDPPDAERLYLAQNGILVCSTAEGLLEHVRMRSDFTGERKIPRALTAYARSVEEYVERKYRKEFEEGRRKGLSEAVCRLAGRSFGADTGERLAELLGTPPDSGRIARAQAAVVDCSSAEELLRRVEGSAGS